VDHGNARNRVAAQAPTGETEVSTHPTQLPKLRKMARSPTAAVCRMQEDFHRARAANAALENVRIISAKAATAWHAEALLADEREARSVQTRAVAGGMARREPFAGSLDERRLSENPDRGYADA
jgi:hypothetical protein